MTLYSYLNSELQCLQQTQNMRNKSLNRCHTPLTVSSSPFVKTFPSLVLLTWCFPISDESGWEVEVGGKLMTTAQQLDGSRSLSFTALYTCLIKFSYKFRILLICLSQNKMYGYSCYIKIWILFLIKLPTLVDLKSFIGIGRNQFLIDTFAKIGAINKLRHTNFTIFLPPPLSQVVTFLRPPTPPSVTSHILQFYT